ncbi:hypothetical protein AQUCO_03100034v1 [Aquilegia coerulea]|uniref:Uncharacterized protein n=1 Tax=Aquilegia coerulea TaxID=218851 RepID=A0A2G5D0G8_AQUCA|nr:hypothetical protein AQUCO_03100034v1 [Aquilegia coerulea]
MFLFLSSSNLLGQNYFFLIDWNLEQLSNETIHNTYPSNLVYTDHSDYPKVSYTLEFPILPHGLYYFMTIVSSYARIFTLRCKQQQARQECR